MHRKVLVAEQTDTVRSVAETVLRQNGYEVIAVSAAEKAREVLELTRPDLIVVSADLQAPDRTPYFEKLRSDSRYSNIPLLLFEPTVKTDSTYPGEIVVSRPFDPKDFLSKVALSLEHSDESEQPVSNPLDRSGIDDDFLDAALGLDGLDVVESEVMDRTQVGAKKSPQASQEKLVGLMHEEEADDSLTDSSKIESLVIPEDSSQIKHQPPRGSGPGLEGSGKLEILSDQFGLSERRAVETQDSGATHDYEWFIDSIKNENEVTGNQPSAEPGQLDSGKLTFTDPAEAVDPVTPSPTSGPLPEPELAATIGVEKFIDEFKKEIEQLRSGETDSLADLKGSDQANGDPGKMTWEEKVKKITGDHVEVFTREFARELGQQVADKIVAKIDVEKLLYLIKSEILGRYRKKS